MKLSHKLKHKIQILQAIDAPAEDGSFERDYVRLIRLWAGVKRLNEDSSIGGIMAIRGVNVSDIETHEIIVRYGSVISKRDQGFSGSFGTEEFSPQDRSRGMSKEFDFNFSDSFESILDFNPIKSDYFVFWELGGSGKRGKLLQIKRVVVDESNKEYVKIKCVEIEEKGTGWNNG